MELTAALLSPSFAVSTTIVFVAVLIVAAWRAPWGWLVRHAAVNRYCAACVAVLGVWHVRAELADGPAVHLLGATLLVLAFGWHLAVIALAVVLLLTTAFTTGEWSATGANGVALVIASVGVSYAVARAAERSLPRHLFVYLFAAAFFGAAASAGASALAALGIAAASGVMDRYALGGNYLPSTLLVLFPEAFITGALVTLAAVYRPEWLVSFDSERYLGEARDPDP